jgi:hypothetical protein
MTRRTVISAFAICVLVAAVVKGQTNPETERGGRPGLSYALTDFDQVNLFNGTMTLNLPVGPTYHVNGALSYRFIASYGTNTWKTEEEDIYDWYKYESHTVYYNVPSEHENAGFGWVVTLGAILPFVPPFDHPAYLAPDGGQHEFFESLHSADPYEPANGLSVRYTRDGTYLRLKSTSAGYVVDFPNGETHSFDSSGRLIRIDDQYGNWVTVTYAGDNSNYVVTDSVGRTHTVYLRTAYSYDVIPSTGQSPPPASHWIVDRVVLAAFDDPDDTSPATAEYKFNYLLPPSSSPESVPTSQKLSRRCHPHPDVALATYVVVPMLTSIDFPESAQYQFDYDYGNHSGCSSTASGGASGNLVKLVLPTGGRIEWTYFRYELGTLAGNNAGVHERTVYDGTTLLGRTEYQKGSFCRNGSSAPICYVDLWRRVIHREGPNFEIIVDATKHYFSAFRSASTVENGGEYGLPLTRSYPLPGDATAFLSSESEQYNIADGQFYPTGRKNWVRYEGDQLLTTAVWFTANQRVAYQRTDYEDGKFSDVTYSEFDGLGHYRKAVTGGNFLSGNVRTTFTNFNSASGTYKLNTDGTLYVGVGRFTLPPSTSPWILNTFDREWASDGTSNATKISASCFDTTGFMTSRRTFKDFAAAPSPDVALPATTTQDLLAVFTRNVNGNLVREQYFGGDMNSAAPTNFSCGGVLTGESYAVAHDYQYGSLKTSKHEQAENTFDLADHEIDLNTGVVSKSYRFRTSGSFDGITTEYRYDKLGRLKQVKDPRSRTDYSYQNQPPKITVSDYDTANSPVLVRTSAAEFDVLGRVVRETRSMPENVTAERKTKYDSLGRKVEVTDWGATVPTVFTYDLFGRPIRVRAPDQTEDTALKIAYSGVSTVERTSKVRTSGDATTLQLANFTDAVTTEEYDRMGRLVRITEPSDGSFPSIRPVTEYTYDVAGHLTGVCAKGGGSSCGQIRTFSYDNRGFLLNETHPENGTTTYAAYDARGHLRRRFLGTTVSNSFQHLGFVYDRAERLTQVHEADTSGNETRKLKLFAYWGVNNANGSNDYSLGRLALAIRFNWVMAGASAFNVEVMERYAYQDPNGNISSRNTTDYVCTITGSQTCTALNSDLTLTGVPLGNEFKQTFTYDALGETTALGYPQCQTNCSGAIAGRTVTNGYSNGFLTSVIWSGALSPNGLTYHPSGLWNEIHHDNGVIDQQIVDTAVPSRPRSLITTNARRGDTCVAPSFTAQPASLSVPANTSFTLQAAASGEDGHVISYQWYRGVAADRTNPISGATSSSLTQNLSSTTSFWVEAKNDCSSSGAASDTSVVSVCTTPGVSLPPDRTITRTNSTTIEATASGSGTLRFQWYTVVNNVASPILGQTASILNPSPLATTRYRAVVTNDCNMTAYAEIQITVIDPPTTPLLTSVFYDPQSNYNVIQWAASSSSTGIARYVIERRPDNYTFPTSSGSITTIQDSYNVVAGRAYAYRVKAVDTNEVASEFSAYDLTTRMSFADDPVRLPSDNGGTVIRGFHVSDLRKAVDAVRFAAGLSPAWASYSPPTGPIYGAHFAELRDRLNEARVLFGLPEVNVSDSVASGQPVRGRTVTELRNGVK